MCEVLFDLSLNYLNLSDGETKLPYPEHWGGYRLTEKMGLYIFFENPPPPSIFRIFPTLYHVFEMIAWAAKLYRI